MLGEGGPYTWPLVTGMIVDDRQQIWFGLRSVSGEIEWAGFDRNGVYVGSFLVPENFVARVVRGNRVIGITRDELDVPSVQVYAAQWSGINSSPVGRNE